MQRLPARIETERLVLRTWTADDAEALGIAITESIEHLRPWMPWIAVEPVALEDRQKLIAEWDAKWQAGEDAVYGVFHDGAVVGGTGLHRRIGPGALEIGYWIHADHVRQGFATEVSAALTGPAFGLGGIEGVEIPHDKVNVASEGVPRSLGYTFTGDVAAAVAAPSESGVQCVWTMTRAEWESRART
jgi:RimJ/RimL family protein N-acetyltransferase